MITREEKVNQKLAAEKALSKINPEKLKGHRVGHNVPTWIIPKVEMTKQQAIERFSKNNNRNKENIQII